MGKLFAQKVRTVDVTIFRDLLYATRRLVLLRLHHMFGVVIILFTIVIEIKIPCSLFRPRYI